MSDIERSRQALIAARRAVADAKAQYAGAWTRLQIAGDALGRAWAAQAVARGLDIREFVLHLDEGGSYDGWIAFPMGTPVTPEHREAWTVDLHDWRHLLPEGVEVFLPQLDVDEAPGPHGFDTQEMAT